MPTQAFGFRVWMHNHYIIQPHLHNKQKLQGFKYLCVCVWEGEFNIKDSKAIIS